MKRPAQPVADLVSKLLNPVIERRAGMTLDLIASWDEIAGVQHAAQSRPEKLLWPRQASDDDPFEPATLVVACEGGHALFLQHDSAAIIARINTYFGFSAVARLKLTQKPIGRREERKRKKTIVLNESKRRDLNEMLEEVTEPKLKAALEKMGKGVFSEGSDNSS
ncbi:MAG: DciA family protein [Rhizobiaceae bacterium]